MGRPTRRPRPRDGAGRRGLVELDLNGLNLGHARPQIDDQTGGAAFLLTTFTFVVGTSAGDFQAYSAIEMDDAVIGEVRAASGVASSVTCRTRGQTRLFRPKCRATGAASCMNSAVAAWAVLAADS